MNNSMHIFNEEACLITQDGDIIDGLLSGSDDGFSGELIFNTSMTGYQEILSDPSYAGQSIVFTSPHIGNVGINHNDMESKQIFASGIIISNLSSYPSNYRAEDSLINWVLDNKKSIFHNCDTRYLTAKLRTRGALKARVVKKSLLLSADHENTEENIKNKILEELSSTNNANVFIKKVSTDEPYIWDEGSYDLKKQTYYKVKNNKYKIAVYDFGVKKNILRKLADHDAIVEVFPYNTDPEKILKTNPDGIFLSNGPGNPDNEICINNVRYLLEQTKHNKISIFGICLGCQLIALALNAKTYKMKFGHHGANHPVQDLKTKEIFITSQNHSFAIDESSLKEDTIITHRSLFDNSIQGIKHSELPIFGFQGHPEASPGPLDIGWLFDKFFENISNNKRNKRS